MSLSSKYQVFAIKKRVFCLNKEFRIQVAEGLKHLGEETDAAIEVINDAKALKPE